jgi:hypothetical protein
MALIEHVPLVEEILQSHEHVSGKDLAGYRGYRGHVYRMLNFCRALAPQAGEGADKFAVACAFHDLHVFETFDYLGPSVASAERYLHASGKGDWLPEVSAMIVSHHKLTAYRGDHADFVEPFRRADWVEMTFGVLRFELPRPFVREVRRAFPIRAFYPNAVLRSALRWWVRHPLSPTPYYPTRRKVAALVRPRPTPPAA